MAGYAYFFAFITDNNVHWWLAIFANPGGAVRKTGAGDRSWASGDSGPRVIYLDFQASCVPELH